MTRRMLLRLIGLVVGAVTCMRARALAACTLTPRTTAGPFWLDEQLRRADLRVEPSDGSVCPGVPLALAITVQRADAGCAPVTGLAVDVWHCDAAGRYSGEAANGTAGKKFLRGQQVTNAAGAVRFTTIFPGWYPGRTVHVHVRVRTVADSAAPFDFATQLFFDDAVSDRVFARAPYDARGPRRVTNAVDGLYDPATRLALASDGAGGFVAAFTVALNGIPTDVGPSPS